MFHGAEDMMRYEFPVGIGMMQKVKLQRHVIKSLYWECKCAYPSLAAGIFEGNGCKITKRDKKIGLPRAGLVTIILVWLSIYSTVHIITRCNKHFRLNPVCTTTDTHARTHTHSS